jgi:hypothetical protein
MHLIKIDDIGAQPFQTCLAFADEMPARETTIVWPLPHRIARLGRDQHAGLALRPHRLADQLFRAAAGIDIGGVDEIHAGVGDDVEQLAHLVELEIADFGEVSLAAEGHRAHRQHRDLEARIAQLPIFHRPSSLDLPPRRAAAPLCASTQVSSRLAGGCSDGRDHLIDAAGGMRNIPS